METAEEDVQAITNVPHRENFEIRNSRNAIYQRTIVQAPQTRARLYRDPLETGNISESAFDAPSTSGSLEALAVKSKIRGFFQGVTDAITGHLPGGHDGKKTAQPKVVRAGKRSAGRTRTAKKLKTRRVGSRTSRNTGLRKKLKPVHSLTDRSSLAPATQTAVFTCPACGLEANKALMLEHLLGSPLHQPGRAQQEQATDHKAGEEQPTVLREEDSSESLRNLLQILLPPRPFGRRHEQKSVKL